MGILYTICNALAILGKRFQDAGLMDICITFGIVASESINGVLDCKHNYYAVRVHKYIYEALMRLAWTEFNLWVEDNIQERNAVIKSFFIDDFIQQKFNKLLQSPLFIELITLWRDFLEHLHYNIGELSVYWMSYIDMVDDVLHGFLRASHEGNWDLHLNTIRIIIP